MEDALHSSGFILLQIQNDLRLGNIQDAFAKSAPVKVADILRSCNSCAAIATDDFEDFLDPFSGQRLCVALDYVWDKAKEDRTKEKAIFIDEAWELIGDDDTSTV